ncbi:hypothetical protein ACP4OV_004662 [Aristida adscensionis]
MNLDIAPCAYVERSCVRRPSSTSPPRHSHKNLPDSQLSS